MTRHEQNLVKRAEKFYRCNEYRHDQTGQRKFERSFESRDLEESEAAIEGENAANEALAAVGRRDISLRSPADIAMLRLDLEYWERHLASISTNLLLTFRAAIYGATHEVIGWDRVTFWRRLKKVENILQQNR